MTILLAGIITVVVIAIRQNEINAAIEYYGPAYGPDATEYYGPAYGPNGEVIAPDTSGSSTNPAGSGTGTNPSGSGEFNVDTSTLTGNPIPPGYGPTDPKAFADSVINLLTRIAGALMIIVLSYGGVLYITSAGNEEGVKKAQSAIKFSIYGIIIVLTSYAIVQFVLSLLY